MTKKTVNGIPNGMHALTAYLISAGAAAAIEFYKNAFFASIRATQGAKP